MKKRLILGILIIASVFTLVSCGKKETSSDTSGTKVTIGNTEDIEDYENEEDEKRENTETQYTEKTFDNIKHIDNKGLEYNPGLIYFNQFYYVLSCRSISLTSQSNISHKVSRVSVVNGSPFLIL